VCIKIQEAQTKRTTSAVKYDPKLGVRGYEDTYQRQRRLVKEQGRPIQAYLCGYHARKT